MNNLIFPMLDLKKFSSDCLMPIALTEVRGRTILEIAYSQYSVGLGDTHPIFIVLESDCEKYALDSVCKRLTNNHCSVVRAASITDGAPLTCMLASETVNWAAPTYVVNYDQWIDPKELRSSIFSDPTDCGILLVEKINPHFSYALLEDDLETVVGCVEKDTVSRHAVAGLYYFRSYKLLFELASTVLLKNRFVDAKLYLSQLVNEAVLGELVVKGNFIERSAFCPFFTQDGVLEFSKNTLQD